MSGVRSLSGVWQWGPGLNGAATRSSLIGLLISQVRWNEGQGGKLGERSGKFASPPNETQSPRLPRKLENGGEGLLEITQYFIRQHKKG